MTNSNTEENNEPSVDNIQEVDENSLEKFIDNNLHTIRDCEQYEAEYKECKSLKGKFHQYFLYGNTLDCGRWKECHQKCKECMDGDSRACAVVILAEKKRKTERLKAHLANDTWKRRENPPSNWNEPLPQWYLDSHAGPASYFHEEKKSCIVQ